MWWLLNEHVRLPDGRTGTVHQPPGPDNIATVLTDGDGELVEVDADELDSVTWP